MDMADIPERLLQLAPPSSDALLVWLRVHVSRLMLEEISRNDREENVAEYLATIEEKMGIRSTQGTPTWYGREVLELERWSEPERQHRDTQPSGAHRHLKRLLACTLLLREAANVGGNCGSDEESFVVDSAPTLIQLTRSAIALGAEAPRLALGFLVWVRTMQPHPAFSPFASFCILLLAICIGLNRVSDMYLSELCGWMEQEEIRCRGALGYHAKSERWLTGLNIHEDRRKNRDRLVDGGRRILAGPIAKYPQTQKCLVELLDRIAG
jgi:hypothetical protein